MQERLKAASPVYTNAVAAFSSAQNLDDLNERFHVLWSNTASGQPLEYLVEAYEQSKSVLCANKSASL